MTVYLHPPPFPELAAHVSNLNINTVRIKNSPAYPETAHSNLQSQLLVEALAQREAAFALALPPSRAS